MLVGALPAAGAGPSVLLVGPAGTPGATYTSIQAAVDAANPGDWVLVAPGVYHEKGSTDPSHPAGVLIQKAGIHLRGMNRNRVIIDGTNVSASQAGGTLPAGSPACSSAAAVQDLGPLAAGGVRAGRNGVDVLGVDGAGHKFLADNVSLENFTACNFLRAGGNGNQIWWNGGDGSGAIGMNGLRGDYLTATSTYFKDANSPAGEYGIFTSNEQGPGVINHSYASNMRDSGFYIGACRDCNITLTNAHSQGNADGFSGTNAGGRLNITNSEFDHGRVGLTSNAQNNDDAPSPQLGQCPAGIATPTGAAGCTFFSGNYVHDNNNPNVPGSGLTAVSAIGTGFEMVATQHNTLINNRVENQSSWGILTHDFPDPESGISNCQGGTPVNPPVPGAPMVCFFQSLGNLVANNQFAHNGGYGNPTNADIANQAANAPTAANPTAPLDPNCFRGNTDPGGLTQWPPTLQAACTPGDSVLLTAEIVCATGAGALIVPGATCPPTIGGVTYPASYPQHDGVCGTARSPGVLTPAGDRTNGVCLIALKTSLSQKSMPNPCAGVPTNAFCNRDLASSTRPVSARRSDNGLLAAAGLAVMVSIAGIVARRRRSRLA
jgi:hypothetical protein